MAAEKYDRIIIGAGLYGLYAAYHCGKRGEKVLVLECDAAPFKRATYINQARVHQGYHYPRSISTAKKSAEYFERFNKDYDFCINRKYHSIYAISDKYSWTDGTQFAKFCKAADIPCEEVIPEKFFRKGLCDSAFLTQEYTYDARILRDYFLEKCMGGGTTYVEIRYGVHICRIEKLQSVYEVQTKEGDVFCTDFLLNATYAATNQILDMLEYDRFKIKYELCEIILCNVQGEWGGERNYGFTVMDGPFFSIMPFGKTDFYSLTSVTFTPHMTSYEGVPVFSCQSRVQERECSPSHLGNCNDCEAKPQTAFPYMASLARKYLKDEFAFEYRESLFSMKPILINSEIDDSRPTVIRTYSKNPTFVGVLSGKINTVYDLDEVLDDGR